MTRAFLCAAALAAAPSLANALTLDCAVPPNAAGGGYITEQYVFEYDGDTGKALAADGLILYIHDNPIEAKVSDDTAKKLVLTWTVILTNSSGQNTAMRFRASYFKSTGEVIVRAQPGGYDNIFESRGTCKKA